MSTKITADNGAEIQVGQLGITVHHPEGIASIWVRLGPWQRRALADALDQDAAFVIGGRLTAPESQYKRERDDLRRQVDDLKERRRKHAAEREAWTRNRRELERERDAAVARAEAHAKGATRANLDRDKAYEELTAMTNRAEQLEKALAGSRDAHQRSADAHMEWKARAEAAEARAALVVTRDEIEKALRECTNDVFASDAYPHMADAVCALFGSEAEQADPVEAHADTLAQVVGISTRNGDVPDDVREACRVISRHVLGQEADHA